MPDTDEGKNMRAIFVISGFRDAGKTHTAWLVYNLLKDMGEEKKFPYDNIHRWTYDEVLTKINEFLQDFAAVIEVKGRKIAVLSQADKLSVFKDEIQWAIRDVKVDYVVCCARKRNRENSVHWELRTKYGLYISNWIEKTYYQPSDKEKRIENAKKISEEVFQAVIRKLRNEVTISLPIDNTDMATASSLCHGLSAIPGCEANMDNKTLTFDVTDEKLRDRIFAVMKKCPPVYFSDKYQEFERQINDFLK